MPEDIGPYYKDLQESDLPGKIIGKSLSICGPKTSLFIISSRTRILLTLPRRVW